jgi:hypothetical protein
MNFKTICCATTIVSAMLCQSVFAEQKSIKFKNQRGSILELNVLPDNNIEGFFTTAVAAKCPQAINQKRPIRGYAVGNALTFSIVYPMCNSVVSITGNFDKRQKSIDTIAIVNKQADDVTQNGLGARFIVHDTYQRIG